jgi:F-type H+-transporting ATPase subunit gamma
MATLRDIKRKIGAVKKTQQITKAMNMVAASKLRSAQERMERFRPYAAKVEEVLNSLSKRVDPDIHPLLLAHKEVKKVILVLITSDRGLCGSYNTNLINMAMKWIKERQRQNIGVSLVVVGRKGRDFFRRRNFEIKRAMVDFMGKYDYASAHDLAKDVIEAFFAGECDEVYLLFSKFQSIAIQKPIIKRVVPISYTDIGGSAPKAETGGAELEYLVEPSEEQLMGQLLPKSIDVQFLGSLLEAVAGEYAARMTAMDNAQSNCKELIEHLTLVYNKARQASITKELMDIVSGAEALKKA